MPGGLSHPMNIPFFRLVIFAALMFLSIPVHAAPPSLFGESASSRQLPETLKPWQDWATWDEKDRDCPTPYSSAEKHLCFWPSRLGLQIDSGGGRFDVSVTVYSTTWVPLPGSNDAWPLEVKADGAAVPVVEHDGHPAVRLPAGSHRLEGVYRWNEIPQGLRLPQEIGILSLALEGQPVESPSWDAQGMLWLKRGAVSEETDKDFLGVKVYALVDDGIPLWLHTEVELIVAGKSREEDLRSILPEGWKLSAVHSQIPVSVDDAGRMKAQVRAGRWTVTLDAFRLDNPQEFSFASDAKPAVADELVAFRAKPDFRMVDISGSPAIDVSQTTFPDAWRKLPVYRWDTATPFRIEERMRGMGLQKPEGLKIAHTWWLDENGSSLTFRDRIAGGMQQIWRLDAAEGQDLGSVRSAGEGQLITRNPQNDAPGVEIRTRNLDLDAAGRMNCGGTLSATGWRADAESLNVTLNLPPGWRLFALFGADWVHGDWLTAWTLLDLFLLLIFSLAVFRLWGFGPAVLAFLAFGLSFHEPGAPRYVWLVLLIPLALLRVAPPGWGYRLLVLAKWLAVAVLVLVLVPFVAAQVQQTLYPQLERIGREFPGMVLSGGGEASLNADLKSDFSARAVPAAANAAQDKSSYPKMRAFSGEWGKSVVSSEKSNLLYDSEARIQTGPGVPDWSWRTVTFGWNGPVQASQQVHPIFISLMLERVLAILRVIFLLALAGVLLRSGAWRLASNPLGKTAVLFVLAVCLASSAQAQFPDESLLNTLRQRLLAPSDAYPHAADIPSVALALDGHRLVMEAQIQTAIRTAVPLPGRLPAWSPVAVSVDGKPEAALRRDDGYLWVVLPEGVHTVRAEGLLADVTEWEWTFQLKPRRVTIAAPNWNVSGVRPDGRPEQQVFFALKQKSEAGVASYDRQDVQSLLVVDRNLELGLIWQVRTTVSRLSPEGKAVSLRIPLLPGENILSSNVVVKDGFIEVRLGAHDPAFSWESELTPSDSIHLVTKPDDKWVEHWRLVASPVWNVMISGLAPIFEPGVPDLVPVWHPWPGEDVTLAISRPEAIAGATVTVNKGAHSVSLGNRQRVSTLDLSLRCSLGEDFLVDLPGDAEVTTLTHNGQALPVRKEGNKLIIPLHPGEQTLSIGWKTNIPLGLRATAGEVGLPVESANVQTTLNVPENRWVLWTFGPLRGPAVRFWSILVCSLLAAWVLGRIKLSPLRPWEWMLLALGLTQVPLPTALIVVGWLFFLVWRGRESFLGQRPVTYNFLQIILIGLTVVSLGIFVAVVGEGLLGAPEMFILGNGSSRTCLNWFQPRSGAMLPQPGCVTVSIWWYRILMLLWALWLAVSLLRWLRWGWDQFSSGGCFRSQKPTLTPPPINPPQSA
jgi:hypothetical protein